MKKVVRNSLLYFCLFTGAVIGTAVITIQSIDYDSYRKIVASEVKKATGRELNYSGDINLNISLEPEISINNVNFANAEWGKDRNMIEIDQVKVKMRLFPLLAGKIIISTIVLDGLDLWLETDKDGLGNWFITKQKKGKSATKKKMPILPIVSLIAVKNSRVQFFNGRTNKHNEYKISFLLTNTTTLRRPFKIVSDIVYNKHPVYLDGEFGSISDMLAGKPSPISLQCSLGNGTVTIDGIINPDNHKGDFIFDIDAKGPNIAELASLGELELQAIGPYAVAAMVYNTPTGYDFGSIQITAGKSDLAGDMALDLSSGKPSIAGQFSSELIAVNDFWEPKKKDKKKKVINNRQHDKKIFSKKEIDLDYLKKVDLDLSITGKKVLYDNLVFDNVKIKGDLGNGNFSIDPVAFQIQEGQIKSNLSATENAGQYSIATLIKAESIPFGRILKDLEVTDKLHGGQLDAVLDLHSKGRSVSAIMAGLDGQVFLDLVNGKIHEAAIDYAGADLITEFIETINPFAKKDDYTMLKCGVINFKFKDGKAYRDKSIGIETEKMNVSGGGSIDLKSEYLDIAIRPKPKKGIGLSIGSIANLVKLRGPLKKPGVELDELGAVKSAASIGMAVATSGLSIIGEAIIGKFTADTSPCKTARQSQ